MNDATVASPLNDEHVALDAHLGVFAGWQMPLRYAGTLAEHEAVRSSCGVFDVSHLGVVDVIGADAEQLILATFTNDVTVLDDGDAQYTLCLDDSGHVRDDLIVYRFDNSTFRAIPNASNTASVVAALETQAAHKNVAINRRKNQAVLAVQGPAARPVVEAMCAAVGVTVTLDTIDYMTFRLCAMQDGDTLMLSRTGYTGEYGFELVCGPKPAATLWQAALANGATPCGLAARDTLRLEMGYPLHGHELTDLSTPQRRNVAFALRQNDATFVGADALKHSTPPQQVMRGVRGEGKRPFRDGMTVFSQDRAVGTLTSGGFSPTLGVAVGLAMIDDTVEIDTPVSVDVRGTKVSAHITRPPFVDADPRRTPPL